MDSNEYQARANALAAVADEEVKDRLVQTARVLYTKLNGSIVFGEDTDNVKKYAFYNRQNGLQDENCPFEDEAANQRLRDNADLVHAVIGIISEGAELGQAIINHIVDGTPLDDVNVLEELGDIDWYKVLGLKAVGYTNEQCQDRNINKLESRYKGGFTQTAANNRDLETERAILENASPQDTNT